MNSSPMVVDNSLHCSDGTVGKTLPVSGSLHWGFAGTALGRVAGAVGEMCGEGGRGEEGGK